MSNIEALTVEYNRNRSRIEEQMDDLTREKNKNYQDIDEIEEKLRYYLRDAEDDSFLGDGLRLIQNAIDEIDEEEMVQRKQLNHQIDELENQHRDNLRKDAQ